MGLDKYSTKELVEELITREGVQELIVTPYEKYTIEREVGGTVEDIGSARILIVID